MQGNTIELSDLPFSLRTQAAPAKAAPVAPIRDVQAQAEKSAILAALKQTANNKARAAALLGIHRTLLYKKMRKHAIALDRNG
jgi:transcriptional regulator of acetoin/glycerol metabolism